MFHISRLNIIKSYCWTQLTLKSPDRQTSLAKLETRIFMLSWPVQLAAKLSPKHKRGSTNSQRHRSSASLTQLSATTCYPLDLLSQHCCNLEPATYASPNEAKGSMNCSIMCPFLNFPGIVSEWDQFKWCCQIPVNGYQFPGNGYHFPDKPLPFPGQTPTISRARVFPIWAIWFEGSVNCPIMCRHSWFFLELYWSGANLNGVAKSRTMATNSRSMATISRTNPYHFPVKPLPFPEQGFSPIFTKYQKPLFLQVDWHKWLAEPNNVIFPSTCIYDGHISMIQPPQKLWHSRSHWIWKKLQTYVPKVFWHFLRQVFWEAIFFLKYLEEQPQRSK